MTRRQTTKAERELFHTVVKNGSLAPPVKLPAAKPKPKPRTAGGLDAGTLRRHLAALRAHAPGVLPLYRAAALREIALASQRGAIDDPAAEGLRAIFVTDDLASTD